MSKFEQIALSDREREMVEEIARQRGVEFEEAVRQLISERIAALVKRRTGKRPANNVTVFSRRNH